MGTSPVPKRKEAAVNVIIPANGCACKFVTIALDELPDLPCDEADFDACAQVESEADRLLELSRKVRFWHSTH